MCIRDRISSARVAFRSRARASDLRPRSSLLVPNRLMTDRETGKLKGFGFCEFMDLAVAESAKRNLNGREYNGR